MNKKYSYMEFKIEYNTIVNKNKNIFYFQHYSQDIEEFNDWIEYHNINFEDYNKLCKEFKEICLEKKKTYIEHYFASLADIQHIDKSVVERYYYFYYREHKFMELMNDRNIKEILVILKGMEQIYYRHQRKNC